MITRTLIFGIIIVLIISLLIFMTEVFLPINAKIEFDGICRGAIIKMEINGGINGEIKEKLLGKLGDKYQDVTVEATENAKYGTDITLRVKAKYRYNGLSGLFLRKENILDICYEKTTVSRRVIN